MAGRPFTLICLFPGQVGDTVKIVDSSPTPHDQIHDFKDALGDKKDGSVLQDNTLANLLSTCSMKQRLSWADKWLKEWKFLHNVEAAITKTMDEKQRMKDLKIKFDDESMTKSFNEYIETIKANVDRLLRQCSEITSSPHQ